MSEEHGKVEGSSPARAGEAARELIRRTRQVTRRKFPAEEKIRIVLEGIRGKVAVSELCRHEGVSAFVPSHNWDIYDFGSGPPSTDRLIKEPFPQYPPEEVVPGNSVVMVTTLSKEVVPNLGKGLITCISANVDTAEIRSDNIPQAIEDLVRVLPFWPRDRTSLGPIERTLGGSYRPANVVFPFTQMATPLDR